MSSDTQSTLLAALHVEPGDETAWLALADWLEESGHDHRAEFVRVSRRLQRLPFARRNRERVRLERRVVELLRGSVVPVVPRLTNSLGMGFILITPGRCRMGAASNERGRMDEEVPAHEVEITRPFYLGTYQVTQAQFVQVMGTNPSHFSPQGNGKAAVAQLDTSNFPVERVSWTEAFTFCTKLSARSEERDAGRLYRLPTEAEWEYAYRGGGCVTTPFYLGTSLSSREANFDGSHPWSAEQGPYLQRTCAVGSFVPNAFGLYDMAGNVWEWCQDWFADEYYRESPQKDPQGPDEGQRRVLRGGAYWNWGSCCRGARRVRNTPESREQAYGFRVAMQWRGGQET